MRASFRLKLSIALLLFIIPLIIIVVRLFCSCSQFVYTQLVVSNCYHLIWLDTWNWVWLITIFSECCFCCTFFPSNRWKLANEHTHPQMRKKGLKIRALNILSWVYRIKTEFEAFHNKSQPMMMRSETK